MKPTAMLNGTPLLNSHVWYAVNIERDSFNEVYSWVFDTFTDSRGTWLCWSDISEIWFEFEEDAALCVLKWQ